MLSRYIENIHKTYGEMGRETKAGLWFIVCNIIQQGVAVVTTPIFTRLLTTEDYGLVSTYQVWVNVLILLVTLQFFYTPFNKAMVRFQNERKEYISSMQAFILVSSVIWVFILFLIKDSIASLISMPKDTLILMLMHTFGLASVTLWTVYQRFEYSYKQLLAYTIFYAVLSTLLGIVLVFVLPYGGYARILSLSVTQFLLGCLLGIKNIGRINYHRKVCHLKYTLKISFALAPEAIVSLFLHQADRIVIQKYLGEADVAYYSLGYSICSLINIFKDAIINAFSPWFYQNMGKCRGREIGRRINHISILGAAIIFLALLFMPEVIYIMGGSKYAESLYVIPPIAISIFFDYIAAPISNILFYYDKMLFNSICMVFAFVLNFGSNILLVPLFGYLAAAYTTLLSYLAIFVLKYIYSLVMLRNKQLEEVLDNKFIMFLCSFMLVTIPFMNMLYKWNSVRYIFIIITIVAVGIFRNRAIRFLQLSNNVERNEK